jgi:hypothetical protein
MKIRRRFTGQTPNKPAQSQKPPTEIPIVKDKKVRKKPFKPNRLFNYRGITFLNVIKDDVISVSTFSENSKPVYHFDVPKENAKIAMQEVAKIALAEQRLQELGIIDREEEQE